MPDNTTERENTGGGRQEQRAAPEVEPINLRHFVREIRVGYPEALNRPGGGYYRIASIRNAVKEFLMTVYDLSETEADKIIKEKVTPHTSELGKTHSENRGKEPNEIKTNLTPLRMALIGALRDLFNTPKDELLGRLAQTTANERSGETEPAGEDQKGLESPQDPEGPQNSEEKMSEITVGWPTDLEEFRTYIDPQVKVAETGEPAALELIKTVTATRKTILDAYKRAGIPNLPGFKEKLKEAGRYSLWEEIETHTRELKKWLNLTTRSVPNPSVVSSRYGEWQKFMQKTEEMFSFVENNFKELQQQSEAGGDMIINHGRGPKPGVMHKKPKLSNLEKEDRQAQMPELFDEEHKDAERKRKFREAMQDAVREDEEGDATFGLEGPDQQAAGPDVIRAMNEHRRIKMQEEIDSMAHTPGNLPERLNDSDIPTQLNDIQLELESVQHKKLEDESVRELAKRTVKEIERLREDMQLGNKTEGSYADRAAALKETRDAIVRSHREWFNENNPVVGGGIDSLRKGWSEGREAAWVKWKAVKEEWKTIKNEYEEAIGTHYQNLAERSYWKKIWGNEVEKSPELTELEGRYLDVRKRYISAVRVGLSEREQARSVGEETKFVYGHEKIKGAVAGRFVIDAARRRLDIKKETVRKHRPEAVQKTERWMQNHKKGIRVAILGVGIVSTAGLSLLARGLRTVGAAQGGTFGAAISHASYLFSGAAVGGLVGGIIGNRTVEYMQTRWRRKESEASVENARKTVSADNLAEIEADIFEKGRRLEKSETVKKWSTRAGVIVGGAAGMAAGGSLDDLPSPEDVEVDEAPQQVSPPATPETPEPHPAPVTIEPPPAPEPAPESVPPPDSSVHPVETLPRADNELPGRLSDEYEKPEETVSEKVPIPPLRPEEMPSSEPVTPLKSEMPEPVEVPPEHYTVQKGDNLWNILEGDVKDREMSETLKAIPEEHRNAALTKLFERVDTDPALRESIGMKSDHADLIFAPDQKTGAPGDVLNIVELEKALADVARENGYLPRGESAGIDPSLLSKETVMGEETPRWGVRDPAPATEPQPVPVETPGHVSVTQKPMPEYDGKPQIVPGQEAAPEPESPHSSTELPASESIPHFGISDEVWDHIKREKITLSSLISINPVYLYTLGINTTDLHLFDELHEWNRKVFEHFLNRDGGEGVQQYWEDSESLPLDELIRKYDHLITEGPDGESLPIIPDVPPGQEPPINEAPEPAEPAEPEKVLELRKIVPESEIRHAVADESQGVDSGASAGVAPLAAVAAVRGGERAREVANDNREPLLKAAQAIVQEIERPRRGFFFGGREDVTGTYEKIKKMDFNTLMQAPDMDERTFARNFKEVPRSAVMRWVNEVQEKINSGMQVRFDQTLESFVLQTANQQERSEAAA